MRAKFNLEVFRAPHRAAHIQARLAALLHDGSIQNSPDASRQLALLITEAGGEPWHLGGFRFPDGSVLRCAGEVTGLESWFTLAPEEARRMVVELAAEPLEVRLPHAFVGRDGRGKRSVAEGRFVYQPVSDHWRLRVEYEGFTDSPLYELEANCFEELVDIGLTHLHVAAARPSQG